MDEKELKKFIDQATENYKALQKAVEEKADIAVLDGLKSDLEASFEKSMMIDDKKLTEYVKEVQGHYNTLEEKVKDLTQKGLAKTKHPEEQVDEFLLSDDWKANVKTVKDGGRPNLKVLTVGSDLVAGDNPVILPMREPGVSAAPRADIPIYNMIQKGSTMSDKVDWIERTLASESPGAATRAENTEFGESDALWTEVSLPVRKITDSFRATVEIIEDTDFVRSEIMSMLTTNIPHLRETQLLSGNNVAPNLKGLLEFATAYSLPTGVDPVADPNAVDGLRAAILQVQLGYNASNAYTKGYQPTGIILNPVDAFNIGGLKDSDGNWILPGWFTGNKAIDGISVIISTDMTAGSFLVLDGMVGKYFTRRGMQVKFWDQYDTDPKFDRVLFTASERGVLRVKGPDEYGLVTGTIDAAVASVTA